MSTKTITQVRSTLAETIEEAATEPVYIERNGKRVGVLVSVERYDELVEALETREDMVALEELDHLPAAEREAVPLEEVMREMGWV